MKRFNVTGLCVPEKHYMCDISNKVSAIAAMVERGDYFTINRARQYGKTTTLRFLDDELARLGYLLTFDFRKENNIGKPQAKWVEHKGKRIFDCMAGV